MSFLATPRRRRFLFAFVALAAGGYLSYRACKSPSFSRRRKQLFRFLSSLSFLGDAASQSAESLSIVSLDLKEFLLSDADTVPRSIRQAFKLGQCSEFQETVTVLSAALTQGLLRGFKANSGTQGCGASKPKTFKSWRNQADIPEDALYREIREVAFTAKGHAEVLADNGCPDCEEKKEVIIGGDFWPTAEKGFESKEWEMKNHLSGGDFPGSRHPSWKLKSSRKVDALPSEDLPERLLAKLFSKPGVGFASAVMGSLARNSVTALLNGIGGPPAGNSLSVDDRASQLPQFSTNPIKKSQILDVVCTQQCRALIAECIQTFVSTAVNVYIEKTKDVNFYDDMVAGVTNPSHVAPMKDVLTSVCNGAIETLVRTSHDVMFVKNSGQSVSCNNYLPRGVEALSREPGKYSRLPLISVETLCQEIGPEGSLVECFTNNPRSSPGIGQVCGLDAQLPLGSNQIPSSQGIHNEVATRKFGGSNSGLQGFIDGLSKTLAVPSNRKLVVDVAATMASEVVRSFVDVVVCAVRNQFSTKVYGEGSRGKSCVSEQRKSRDGISDAAVKAFLLATICLAICLHVLMGVRLLDSA